MLADGQKEQKLKFEVLVPVISKEQADRVLLVQLPPGALRPRLRHPDRRRRGRAHRVPRLRPRARGDGAVQDRTASIPERGRPRCARSSGREPRRRPAALDAATYQRHALHAEDRVWVEKNCYVDIWIEVLHALGLRAAGDAAVRRRASTSKAISGRSSSRRTTSCCDLYGVDVQELNVWRPLLEHARRAPRRRQADLDRGRRVLAARHRGHRLPARSTPRRRSSSRTSISTSSGSATSTTPATTRSRARTSRRLFRVGAAPDPTFMPLFAELVRIDRVVKRPAAELRAMSRALLARHLARRPADNPVRALRRSASRRDLPGLTDEGPRRSITRGRSRRCASSARRWSCLQLHLRWLERSGAGAGGRAVRQDQRDARRRSS